MPSYLTDGQSTTINLTGAGVIFCEKSVAMPKISMGGGKSTTCMRNTTVHTQLPKKLKKYDKITIKIEYSTDCMAATYGVNQQIVVTWSNGKTLTFWGWVDEFDPGTQEEGKQPEGTLVIEISNTDGSGNESPPVQN